MSFPSTIPVDLCGIPMSTALPAADGVTWLINDIVGWDSPTMRVEDVEPTGRDGSVRALEFFGARLLTIEGSAHADTTEAAWGAYRVACGSLPGLRNTGELVVHEDIPMALTIRQASKPVVFSPVSGSFTFTLNLTADDVPFKRGPILHTRALTAGATASVTNAGTAPAILSLTATGSGTVVVQQNTSGQVLRTRTSVASGTTFDGTGRRVTTAGGVDIFPMGAPSEWLSIPAASTVTLTNLGTASVSASWYDLYA